MGNKFITFLITNHKPLVNIFRNKEPVSRKYFHWIYMFSDLKIIIQFEEGRKNVIADTLSRMETKNVMDSVNQNVKNKISNCNNLNGI